MSTFSALHSFVHARFNESFGQSTHTLGHDRHWSLRPAQDAISIDVLLNGGVDVPSVWIFDPYDSQDGVVKAKITTEAEALASIKEIQDRLKDAASRQNRS